MSKDLIFALLVVIALIITFLIAFFGNSYEYILIDGTDVIEYEIVDGDTIIIHTKDEQYKVQLSSAVVDFTVNSNITIELGKELIWGTPVTDYYYINRIIKTPMIMEGDK